MEHPTGLLMFRNVPKKNCSAWLGKAIKWPRLPRKYLLIWNSLLQSGMLRREFWSRWRAKLHNTYLYAIHFLKICWDLHPLDSANISTENFGLASWGTVRLLATLHEMCRIHIWIIQINFRSTIFISFQNSKLWKISLIPCVMVQESYWDVPYPI